MEVWYSLFDDLIIIYLVLSHSIFLIFTVSTLVHLTIENTETAMYSIGAETKPTSSIQEN